MFNDDNMLISSTNLKIVNDIKSRNAQIYILSYFYKNIILKSAKNFDHFDCPPISTPYDGNIHLRKNEEQCAL